MTAVRLGEAYDCATARHARRPGRWIATVVVVLLAARLVHLLVTNPRFEWPVVFEYVRARVIVEGLGTTLLLTVVCMVLGCLLGVVVALCRQSSVALLRTVSAAYVWFFRGTPPLVQLIFWFNLAALMPTLSLAVPFGPELVHWNTNALISPLTAAVLGLSLNEGAYMAEIIRAGILSVDHGQTEAAKALSMGRLRTFTRIVLPQAMRFIVPPTGTQVINMVKATSLVSVIALGDLLYSAQVVYNRTFQTIPLLIVACVWYLAVTSVLYGAQTLLERRYARGGVS